MSAKCERCGVELVDGVAGEYEADEPHLDHTDARCAERLVRELTAVRRDLLALGDGTTGGGSK